MSPIYQVWPKPSCKAQQKEEEDKTDRGRGGKTTSGNGQAWSSPSPTVVNGTKWRKLVAKSSKVPKWLSRLRDRWWWWWTLTPQIFCFIPNVLARTDNMPIITMSVVSDWGQVSSHNDWMSGIRYNTIKCPSSPVTHCDLFDVQHKQCLHLLPEERYRHHKGCSNPTVCISFMTACQNQMIAVLAIWYFNCL